MDRFEFGAPIEDVEDNLEREGVVALRGVLLPLADSAGEGEGEGESMVGDLTDKAGEDISSPIK